MNHAERWSGAGARALVDLPSFRAVQGNPRTRRLSRLLFAVVAAVFGSLFIIPWQQTSISGGRVVAYAPLERRQNIEAPIEGRIVSWAVHEGTRVKKGDLVAVISDNDPELVARMRLERSAVENRVEAARARVRSMEDRIISLETSRSTGVSAAGSRARMARDRVMAAEHAVDAADGAVKTSQLNLDRQRTLAKDGLTSTRGVEVAELEQLRSRTDAERARAALSAAKSEELALKSDHEKVGSDARALIRDAEAAKAIAQGEVANSEAELTRVDVRLARQASQRIMAPRDGTVLKLLAAQGSEMVKGGDPIAVLIPDTEERAVELHVDGNDLPLVAEGRRVRLQFEGWPAVQFSGWPQVAVGTFGGTVSLVDSSDDGKGKFRVVVRPDAGAPWPESRYLRQGVRAQGFILLGRVSLAYELWRQFNGFPASNPAPPKQAEQAEGKSK
ncbi:MAG TPA: HlyD family efflux transporter periplasmic adaptor subunit [Polyangiaceae bacterium]|nr:HlyD family efflux transporter periplasmic adaptor subunit [Polyangiaceae bacterium]